MLGKFLEPMEAHKSFAKILSLLFTNDSKDFFILDEEQPSETAFISIFGNIIFKVARILSLLFE